MPPMMGSCGHQIRVRGCTSGATRATHREEHLAPNISPTEARVARKLRGYALLKS